MCGIAGICRAADAPLDVTATARLLVAGLAERGQDATGYAYHAPDGQVAVVKDSIPLTRVHPPARAAAAGRPDGGAARPRLHEGPAGAERQQPPDPLRPGRRGAQRAHRQRRRAVRAVAARNRSTPDITVDSEAIMMLVDELGDAGRALELVRGSAAVAVLRDGQPDRVTIAKRASRTLFLGRADGIALFASTREPLELARDATGHPLRIEEVHDGTRARAAGRRGRPPQPLPRRPALRRPAPRALPEPAREARARPARAGRVPLGRGGLGRAPRRGRSRWRCRRRASCCARRS